MDRHIVKRLSCIFLLLITGCSTPLASSVGYYGPTPSQEKVKGSYGHYVQTYVVDYDTEDVRKAVMKAAAINGMTFDVTKEDMLSGVTQWVPPGFAECIPSQVYAVYMSVVGKRKTSVTIVADQLTWCANKLHPEILLVRKFAGTMNSVLATYE